MQRWEHWLDYRTRELKLLVRSGIPNEYRGDAILLLLRAHAAVLDSAQREVSLSASSLPLAVALAAGPSSHASGHWHQSENRKYYLALVSAIPDHAAPACQWNLSALDAILCQQAAVACQPHVDFQRAVRNVALALSAHFSARAPFEPLESDLVAHWAALLLTAMPEHDAFAALVALANAGSTHRLWDLFRPGAPLLEQQLHVFGRLLLRRDEELFLHLAALGLAMDEFAANWFACGFFGAAMPLSVALRILDVLAAEGPKVLFRCALATMKLARASLLAAGSSDDALLFLRELQQCMDADLLINVAFLEIDLQRAEIAELEIQHGL
jgi:hypothetical protein